MREYDALKAIWEDARTFQIGLVAAVRADLHNTSARDFGRQFEAAEFMPGAMLAIEERIAELIAQGYNPAAAAAIATSKTTKEQQIHAVDSIRGQKAQPGKRAARSR